LKKSALEDSVIFKGDDNKYFEKRGKELVCIDDEIPFEIPNSWEWVRFGSIINMRMGKTPARGDVDYWTNGKTPWVSISDMFDYGIITNTKEKVSDFAIQTAFGGNIVPKGTLIMSFKLTVGRTSLLDIDAVHNEAIISIIPYFDKKDSLRDYLFYVLPLISNFGDSKDAIKGKTLNSTSLFNLLIPLPPIADQRRIVNAIVTAWQVL
jgi:type I restriction enzyme S subunit